MTDKDFSEFKDDVLLGQYIVSDDVREKYKELLSGVVKNLGMLVDIINDESVCMKVGRSTLMHHIIYCIERVIGENEVEG